MIDPSADVRLAARALARHRLVHAYGHVSARVDPASFLVTPPHPLGKTRLDTQLVTVPVEGDLPPGALPEVRMHQAIYRARSDVGGICRFQSDRVIALSALRRTPRALHGLGAYFARDVGDGPPLWDDPMLVRDVERANAVATTLGSARGIVLRGNGAVTVGPTVREALCHAFFLEDAAKVELSLLGQDAVAYSPDEASKRGNGGTRDQTLYDRMWEYLLDDDEVRS